MDKIKKNTKNINSIYNIDDFISQTMKDCLFKDSFYKLMYYHFKTTLLDDFLVKVDRMSMAHSLETRIPFLDYRLVEFMAKVDKKVKIT